MSIKLTTKEFIRSAKEIHGDKYDYSKTEYKNIKEKVLIICKEHGGFSQTPDCHLCGNGCPKCSGRNKTTEEFIFELIKIHGDKYDYSEVNYVNAKTKVILICKEHGRFKTTPNLLLSKRGCPKCAGNISLNTSSFVKKANQKHENKYDYSRTHYINNHTKVLVICPIDNHGEFLILPSNHIKTNKPQGCPKCGVIKRAKSKSQTKEDFIKDCNKIHSNYDKYDLSLVPENFLSTDKIKIICTLKDEFGNMHGEFEQQSYSFKKGREGCSLCSSSGKKKPISYYVNKIRSIRGDDFDISNIKSSTTVDDSVDFVCPIHGTYSSTIYRVLNCNEPCRYCAGTLLNQKFFIQKAKEIHGNKYDYSEVNYINGRTKVVIKCLKHGKFEQNPESHLSGQGCPICNCGFSEQYILSFIKSIKDELPNMTQQEYYVLLQQSKILNSEHGKRLLKKPKGAIKDLLSSKENKITKPKDDLKDKIREKIKHLVKTNELKDDSDLKPINPKNILKNLDKSIDKIKTINSSADEEAIEYLKSSALNKLWNYAYLNPNLSLDDIKELLNK